MSLSVTLKVSCPCSPFTQTKFGSKHVWYLALLNFKPYGLCIASSVSDFYPRSNHLSAFGLAEQIENKWPMFLEFNVPK